MSKSNKIKVVFDTDDSISSKGFKFRFKESCGQKIPVSESGIIKFYKHEVNNSQNCIWTLSSAEPGGHVSLVLTHIGLDHQTLLSNSTGDGVCNGKNIEIFEGDSIKSPLKTSFCSFSPNLISLGSDLTLKVPTETISEFEAAFSIVENSCGGSLRGTDGRFSSPMYPDSYSNNIQCTWTISALPGNLIQLNFENFDLVESENCNEDYLEIREGSSTGNLIGVFCGKYVPTVPPKRSYWIKFRSDDDDVGKGFLVKYNYCKYNLFIFLIDFSRNFNIFREKSGAK